MPVHLLWMHSVLSPGCKCLPAQWCCCHTVPTCCHMPAVDIEEALYQHAASMGITLLTITQVRLGLSGHAGADI